MAQSEQRIQSGNLYQIELEGQVVGEFAAERARTMTVEGVRGADCFVSPLPANFEETRDTFTSRPTPPLGRFRANDGRVLGGSWTELLRQPAGVYFATFDRLGAIRIELDPS